MKAFFSILLILSVSIVPSGLAFANSSRDFSNVSSLLSLAGIWTPNEVVDPVSHGTVGIIGPMYSQIQLPNGRSGLILHGWPFDPSAASPLQIKVSILEQNSDGTLVIATDKYLSDPMAYGSNSVVVGDFNNDKKDDFLLIPYNENPSMPTGAVLKPSALYLSNVSGTFTKAIINDPISSHAATLANLNGKQTIFTTNGERYYTFGSDGTAQVNTLVNTTTDPWQIFFSGMSINAADFDGDGTTELVAGDLSRSVDGTPNPNGRFDIVATKFDQNNHTSNPFSSGVQIIPYFGNRPEYSTISSAWGLANTHTYRIWVDDFNHDGKPDLVCGQSLWPEKYSVLQLQQNISNNGAMAFTDVTDTLNNEYRVNSEELDYSMQLVDYDNSGINTYLMAGMTIGGRNSDNSPNNLLQTNYILLNDGTGRLHTYMHDQFPTIGAQVLTYIRSLNISGAYIPNDYPEPRFIEYLTPSGKINLEAEIGFSTNVNGNWIAQHGFINIPLQLDPAVDYTENVTISNRNGSKLIRTWAGNDAIIGGCPAPSNTPCSINGGLGVNTMNYGGARSNYAITTTASGFTVKDVVGIDGTDNIKNMQVLNFAGSTIDLRTAGSIPAPPTLVNLSGGTGSITVSFTAPTGDTTNFTGYTATCSSSGLTTESATGTGSPIVVTGLVNNKRYSCSVHADTSTVAGNESSTVTKVAGRPNLAAILGLLLD